MRLLLVMLALVSINSAASPVEILGIEIGGKPLAPLPSCPTDYWKTKRLCASERPFVSKGDGGMLQPVSLANQDTIPEWAAFGSATISMTKSRVVTAMEISLVPFDNRHAIANSITQRFGLPDWTNLASSDQAVGANWKTPDLSIRMACGRERCSVSFEVRMIYEARMQEYKKLKDGRKGL